MTAGAVNQQRSLPQHHPHHLPVLTQHSNSSSGNGNYNSPSISPLRHHHPSNIPLRHHRPYFNQDSSPMVLNDGTIVSGGNSSGSKSSNNFEIPIFYHHPQHHFPPHRNAGIMNSPIGKAYVAFISNILFISSFFPAAESFPPFHHFHHQPATSSHNYQNFLNPQVHQQNTHYHQYNSNGGNGNQNQGNNGNLSRSNSSHMIQSHQQKKSYSWKSKNNHHNNSQKNRTNSGDHHSNSSCSSSSSSSSAASNSRNNSKGNTNLRTLTYVSTDYVNSRSTTPSPKSVSPIFQGCKRLPQQQSTASSTSSLHQLDTLAQIQPQNSGFPGDGVSNALGYESDSSHSSYNTNKQVVCGGVDFPNSDNVSGFGQVASEITSLMNFPTYSDEDIPGSQLHYGSQQNLSYWNTMQSQQQQQQQQHTMQNPYSQFPMGASNSPTLYSNVSCGTSDGELKRG